MIWSAPNISAERGIHFIDVGVSGGVWGLDRGYCMMIGGPKEQVDLLDPIFLTLAPGIGTVERTKRAQSEHEWKAEHGYVHCGPAGSGHFTKMIHNGIEYGMMQAYAEGFDILKARANEALDTSYQLNLSRHCRSVAARQRDLVMAARPDFDRARRGPDLVEIQRPRRGFGRRPLDDRRGDGGSGPGRRARRVACSRATAAGSRKATPTNCCRRCASASAATSKCRNKRR